MAMSKPLRDKFMLLFFVLLALAVGSASGRYFSAGDWYAHINKPFFNPPDWIFAPVWALLFLLMGVNAWLVWRGPISLFRDRALIWWGVQLALNVTWSALFFGLHRIGWAMAELALLWLAILMTQLYSWRVSRAAGILYIPYLGWVSFALILNIAIWRLNGGWF
jgi:benzodiazapine receptor